MPVKWTWLISLYLSDFVQLFSILLVLLYGFVKLWDYTVSVIVYFIYSHVTRFGNLYEKIININFERDF